MSVCQALLADTGVVAVQEPVLLIQPEQTLLGGWRTGEDWRGGEGQFSAVFCGLLCPLKM